MSNKFIVFTLGNTCKVHAGSYVSKTHKYVSKISLVPLFSLTHEITIYAEININQEDNIFINVKSRVAWCNIFIVDSLFSMKFLYRKAFIEFQSEKRIPVFEFLEFSLRQNRQLVHLRTISYQAVTINFSSRSRVNFIFSLLRYT